MKAWVERQAAGYGNAGDYIRDLTRKDQEREPSLALLQAAVAEGIERGAPQPFDAETFKLRMRERHGVR
ncbi:MULTISPECIES: ribbon-helix-helix domain-containing protein [Methylosinus]|uniref:Type II toxin-antitoxin system ParD family antitoxin n=1 Tax=Methylosinus trichosporium (strain ATCC 35070 / NCIMB 11131 / UNIQEM 75 / OB3b) TaxID=595536 RepID=A0A2D2CX68_METT3|nr:MULTISPECIES: type II toxin-antitoxin system ParD family antitoxin [Methylosinus]ATQ67337.1 type II toxin-antitoxin system ParD family antitoxin [Methylosinus trichosporium OB3b]OBS50682.1 addiction module antitoxin [Methylosinus sp. 3S-1]